jgi:phosphate transport system substrate-binding protein
LIIKNQALRYFLKTGVKCTLLFFCLTFIQCNKRSGNASETIQIKGSDTVVNLVQAWVEAFRDVDPSIKIEVSGGGSGVGIAALERGAIDIATASRNIKPKEAETVLENTGKEPVEHIIAFDGLALYVNKNNPIDSITISDLARIYGDDNKVTHWSDLGITIPKVKSDKIIRISRQSSSGTYDFFREKVLHKKDFSLGSCDMNGSKEVVELVGITKTAIGYSGMGYATHQIKMLKLIKKTGDTAYAPTVENTINKKYPLARSLQMYTLGKPEGSIKKFIDWVLSEEGQELVAENGFVPVANKTTELDSSVTTVQNIQ